MTAPANPDHVCRPGTRPRAVLPVPRPLLLTVCGLGLLLLGLLVYWTDRNAESAALIAPVSWLSGRHWFGTSAQWLPSLAHSAGFGLLCAAALPARSAWPYLGCAAWALLDVAAELGQIPAVSRAIAYTVQANDLTIPGTQAVVDYLRAGTFDPLDVTAAIAGAGLAAVVIRWSDAREARHADD
jgi:hypothetical protein